MKIGTFEAKTKLSALFDRVVNGETIQITRRGRPIPENQLTKPLFGSEKGLICYMSDDFNEPLDDFGDHMP